VINHETESKKATSNCLPAVMNEHEQCKHCTQKQENISTVLFRGALIVRWYRPIVVYTVGKYKFYFYYQKYTMMRVASVSGKSSVTLRCVTLLLGAFLFCQHSAVLQVSKSRRMTIGA